jgi:hypothetical protein
MCHADALLVANDLRERAVGDERLSAARPRKQRSAPRVIPSHWCCGVAKLIPLLPILVACQDTGASRNYEKTNQGDNKKEKGVSL